MNILHPKPEQLKADMKDCVFCKIIKREIPSLIIDENDQVMVFLSLENHPLVVTKKHIEDIYKLDEETGSAIMIEAIKIARAVNKAINPDGINLVQANGKVAHQDIFHFHLHVKPRWESDGITLHWPIEQVPADIREKTAEKIKLSLSL